MIFPEEGRQVRGHRIDELLDLVRVPCLEVIQVGGIAGQLESLHAAREPALDHQPLALAEVDSRDLLDEGTKPFKLGGRQADFFGRAGAHDGSAPVPSASNSVRSVSVV